MATDALEQAERLWLGQVTTAEVHPVTGLFDLVEVGGGTAFIAAFGNISAFVSGSELVLIDTGNLPLADANHAQVRRWTPAPLHTAVFSHGHIDHVFGVGPYDTEAAANNRPAPTVIAHELVPARFERYRLTAGYNRIINARQFGLPNLAWPTEYRQPDVTYRTDLVVDVGDERFELHHAMGETDDHTWTWVPGRRTLCCGDLFIWATPNCGNPHKVQRYPKEWADALRRMAAIEPAPEILLPGHGLPILGRDRIGQALTDTADLLDHLVNQTLALMNDGARLDDIVHTVAAPAALADLPYLQPIYDEPEFVVRSIWRRYGGWYDGNPAHLKPAPDAAVAAEVAALAGGAARLADRATELAETGDLRLAGHLAEWAAQAAPHDEGIALTRSDVLARRAAAERSTMARGLFRAAATG